MVLHPHNSAAYMGSEPFAYALDYDYRRITPATLHHTHLVLCTTAEQLTL